MPDIDQINRFLQERLALLNLDSVTAVEAGEWLDQAGLLTDSATRPGLPLRRLLRASRVVGQRQESNSRWFIDRVVEEVVSLPPLNENGDLPPGVYPATLQEVKERFGTESAKRQALFLRLKWIYQIAVETGHLARFVVFGSFVTTKLAPNDVDVFMLMENSFDYSQLTGEAHLLFDHTAAQDHFGGSIFWVRRLAAFDGEDATIAHWQIKRDGMKRGIVEIVQERP